ncbi:MAG TPA: hypothetical protein VF590_12055 [Isosphaeraceae bacterium]|jgi:hypothetical protein
MAHPPNGPRDRPGRPPRIDRPCGSVGDALGPRHSGRAFVVAAVLTVLLIWGLLALAFRDWRVRYRARADFGRHAVAAAIDPLASSVPPGVSPPEWRRAVDATHAMLVEVATSGRLDRPQLEALRADLARRVAGARPETARAVLAGIWDAMESKTRLRDPTRRPELAAGPRDASAAPPGPASRAR